MAEQKSPKISYIVSLCGIMCGLAFVVMFFLSFIPAFEYISPAVAGVLIWVIRERLGVKYGLISYVAVGLLCLLISYNYEASLMFIFLLGYYPIVRQYLMKIPVKVLRLLAKLGVYAVTAVSCYIVLINLFGMKQLLDEIGEYGEYGALALLGMGAVAFVMYDIFLGLFFPFYEKLLKPKIQKRMK